MTSNVLNFKNALKMRELKKIDALFVQAEKVVDHRRDAGDLTFEEWDDKYQKIYQLRLRLENIKQNYSARLFPSWAASQEEGQMNKNVSFAETEKELYGLDKMEVVIGFADLLQDIMKEAGDLSVDEANETREQVIKLDQGLEIRRHELKSLLLETTQEQR